MGRTHYKVRRAGRLGRFEVEIEKLVYGGDGLGHYKGKVVFVPFSAPGDRVEVRAVDDRKGYTRAVITRSITPGPGRVTPACPHFGACGGCQWQHLEYSLQVETKRRLLEEAFRHRFPETRQLDFSMKASPAAYAYRSRARIQLRGAGDRRKIGFFRHTSHAVEDVARCPLLAAPLDEAWTAVRGEHGAVRIGPDVQELEIACTADGAWEAASAGTLLISGEPPSGAGLLKRVGGFLYEVSASVFFQANEFMLEDLVASAVRPAHRGKAALDLYAGVGFFTLPLARRFDRVVAVESNPAAHRLCVRNASRADLDNVEAVCAEVLRWMDALAGMAPPAFDLVLLDPPRTGAEPGVMQRLAEWAPERVVYVSCDLQTLVRDLAAFPAADYRIEAIAGLDLFPQSCHFEVIAALRRR
jgi:23S rRNA (uracil1939-C5)-methyltransferase